MGEYEISGIVHGRLRGVFSIHYVLSTFDQLAFVCVLALSTCLVYVWGSQAQHAQACHQCDSFLHTFLCFVLCPVVPAKENDCSRESEEMCHLELFRFI